jgi:predicted dehydrogenase
VPPRVHVLCEKPLATTENESRQWPALLRKAA